jgi:hypothetical protein
MGEVLRWLGARWVICWDGRVADATARAFAREFYKALTTEGHNTDFRYAFVLARSQKGLAPHCPSRALGACVLCRELPGHVARWP